MIEGRSSIRMADDLPLRHEAAIARELARSRGFGRTLVGRGRTATERSRAASAWAASGHRGSLVAGSGGGIITPIQMGGVIRRGRAMAGATSGAVSGAVTGEATGNTTGEAIISGTGTGTTPRSGLKRSWSRCILWAVRRASSSASRTVARAIRTSHSSSSRRPVSSAMRSSYCSRMASISSAVKS